MSTDWTMHRNRIFALAFSATFAGCAPPKKNPTPGSSQQPTNLQQPAHDRAIEQAATGGSDVDALARKTQAYSREMTPLIAPHPVSAAPVPSVVQWMDPSQLSLTSGASAKPNAAASVVPVEQSTQTSAPIKSDPIKAEANSSLAMVDPLPRGPRISASSDLLSDKLSKRVKDDPSDVSAQLEYQLLKFLLDEPTPNMQAMANLPNEDREMVSSVVDGLTNFRNGLRADSNMLLSRKIRPLVDMSERLEGESELTIPTTALCTSVKGFAAFDPIDPPRFSAGAPHEVIVYSEVANFTSQLNDKHRFETKFSWEMTLYTEQGMSVWSGKPQEVDDEARTRRHDFFINQKITLPPTLTIGRYLLKLTIIDTQSNRVAESTLPIVIAAK